MAIGDIIVGIDIGSSKVNAVIGEVNNFNQIEIIATSECKCCGMKKTTISDEAEIARAIENIVSENSIFKEAKDKYAGISSKDLNSAIMQIRDIDIPDDKVLIDIVANEFALDNGRVVEDPVGSLSSAFTVKGQVVLADKEYAKKLTNVFKKANLDIDRNNTKCSSRKKLNTR